MLVQMEDKTSSFCPFVYLRWLSHLHTLTPDANFALKNLILEVKVKTGLSPYSSYFNMPWVSCIVFIQTPELMPFLDHLMTFSKPSTGVKKDG